MKDIGVTRYILGMEIKRDRAHKKICVSQRKYVNFVLERFNMTDCRQLVNLVLQEMKLFVEDCPKSPIEMEETIKVPFASVVGSLMYAFIYTRPDIAQVMGVLSRFMDNPGWVHWDAVKRVFRYLWGTFEYSLCFHGNHTRPRHSLSISGYVDSDWAGDTDSRRSTSGYVFMMFGGAVSWMNKKQLVVALSTTEAEYMATTYNCKQANWLQRLCSDIDGKVKLEKVETLANVANAMTKPMSTDKFKWCAGSMGLGALSS
ncbi:secreted RxLR effector protein 161-like [Cryptomeria japonica]|uniref:secreted RxLR effector protein 161-like n=1 Tax=Cryptomeria japonica TaxID=3369 RepID=UPI0027DA4631|nr:secreted RxLR effector protein 161-like [Cryptomeria japonica]